MNFRGSIGRVVACIGAALCLLFGIGLTQLADAAEPHACAKYDVVKLQVYPGLIQNLVPWVAEAEGFFKKNCLKPQMLSFPSAPAALAASLQGGLNFISVAPDTVYVPVAHGFHLKMVAFMNDTVHYALVAGKNAHLPPSSAGMKAMMKALVGKRIGVNALGSTTDILAKSLFTAEGLNYNDAAWVAYGPASAAIAALDNGSLDAAMFFGDGMDIAAAATGGRIVVDLRDPAIIKSLPLMAGMPGSSLLWVAEDSYIHAHPGIVRRFALANNEAIAWIKQPGNFDKIVKLVGKKAPSPPGVAHPEALLKMRVRRYIPQEDAHATMSSLEAWAKWDVMMKRIPKVPDINSLLSRTAAENVIR